MTDLNLYQQLVENLDDVLFIISPDWHTIHYISPSYEKVWGKSTQSLYDQPLSWLESLHPDDHKRVMAYIELKTSGKLDKISFPEYRVIRADRSFTWIKAKGFAIYNDNGELDRIVGIASDISEQKEKELAIKLNEETLNMVLDGSQQGFWDWNMVSGEVKRNDRWAQMLGYFTIKEFEDNTDTWTDNIHPDDRQAAWTSINSHLQGLTTFHDLEYRMRKKDGSYTWIHDHARIVQRNEQGEPTRMSGTHTDISARKKLEQEKDELVVSLKDALAEIKDLRGIIPICSYCHNIRNEEGAWDKLELYISSHSDATFSHGICPACLPKAMANVDTDDKKDK